MSWCRLNIEQKIGINRFKLHRIIVEKYAPNERNLGQKYHEKLQVILIFW